jgi:sugar (pentulose or hexulose) kinase
MMSHHPDLVIGIDCSTSACKAVIFDAAGSTIAEGRHPLTLSQPQPGWHEQNADDWWEATIAALRQAVRQVDVPRLAAVCITHQRETFVPVDRHGNPLRQGILWMDERARSYLEPLETAIGKQRFHHLTGKPMSINLTAAKIAWLREHEANVFAKTVYYLDVHAFLVQRLTGQYRTGWGCADPTGLFDMTTNTYADEILSHIGIHCQQLPEAFAPGTVIGTITQTASLVCGLPAGLPVIAGIGDGQSCGLGVNITHPGDAYLNLGTSVISGVYSSLYSIDRAYRTMVGGIPGTYLLETALLGGTYTVNWFIEKFGAEAKLKYRYPQEYFDEEAAKIPPGSEGLMLVPYWNSVMNPYWDAAASGIVVGWRGRHTPLHLYRAILEGIAFEQRLITQEVEKASGLEIERFIAVGGGSRSATWCQIIADIIGKTVFRAGTVEAAALGSAILAASAAGLYPDPRSAAAAMTRREAHGFEPDPIRGAFYEELYQQVYRHLFPSLQPFLQQLTRLTENSDS